jgi:arginine-tRNA-protein transferase
MYKAKRILPDISGAQLDQYLRNGWFRMNQSVFTTEFLQMELDFFDAIWLRHKLDAFEFPKWFYKLKRNKNFSVTIVPFHLTQEHEMLYQVYRESKPEGFPQSLESILFGDSPDNIFNTIQIDVRKDGALVASGFFDLGATSAAGIVSYFDPAYKNLTLGKYATLLAYEYCKQKGLAYFYPGYFAPGNPAFDYKLDLHQPSLEYFDVPFDAWVTFGFYKREESPFAFMRNQLLSLVEELDQRGLTSTLVHNAHFAFVSNSRWDSPLFVHISTGQKQYAVTYDTNTNLYNLFDHLDLDDPPELIRIEGKMISLEYIPLKKPIAELTSAETMASRLILLTRQ